MYPFPKKYQAPDSLMNFIQDIVVPQEIVMDGALEETKGPWKKAIDKSRIQSRESEPYSQWQNLNEGEIIELKRFMKNIDYSLTVLLGCEITDVSGV